VLGLERHRSSAITWSIVKLSIFLVLCIYMYRPLDAFFIAQICIVCRGIF
jgi:hypothetical protein